MTVAPEEVLPGMESGGLDAVGWGTDLPPHLEPAWAQAPALSSQRAPRSQPVSAPRGLFCSLEGQPL